jgi:hypothetical protein
MNKMDIKHFFVLFKKIMQNCLLNQPGKTFNIDESGLQLNDKNNEKVVAAKGSKGWRQQYWHAVARRELS